MILRTLSFFALVGFVWLMYKFWSFVLGAAWRLIA